MCGTQEDLNVTKEELAKKRRKKPSKKANELSGSEWVKNSISIWSDIRLGKEERAHGHPAPFPVSLVEKLLRCFACPNDKVVLDPFCGSGSTLVAANNMKLESVGIELYSNYAKSTRKRLKNLGINSSRVICGDSRNLSKHLPNESVDIVVTSPPYWDILLQRRTADLKDGRFYGNAKEDLGTIQDYNKFIDNLYVVFDEIYKVLKPQKYFIVNVMDLRKGPNFFPFHMDIVEPARAAGFILDDIIIWDRRLEYNNLRALGFPAVFRINKVHEFLMIFKKVHLPSGNV